MLERAQDLRPAACNQLAARTPRIPHPSPQQASRLASSGLPTVCPCGPCGFSSTRPAALRRDPGSRGPLRGLCARGCSQRQRRPAERSAKSCVHLRACAPACQLYKSLTSPCVLAGKSRTCRLMLSPLTSPARLCSLVASVSFSSSCPLPTPLLALLPSSCPALPTEIALGHMDTNPPCADAADARAHCS